MQLVNDAAPVDISREECQDVTALKFTHDFDRNLIGFCATYNGCKAGHTTINQLDAPRAELYIIDRTVQVTMPVGLAIGGSTSQGEIFGHFLRLKTIYETDGFNDLCRQ